MTQRHFLLGAAVALATLGTGPVKAADLDPALEDPPTVYGSLPSMPMSNVVFGSGWYVRGDFGGTRMYQVNPTDQGILGRQAANYAYGDAQAPSISLKPSHEFGYIGDIGGGYAFLPWLRADVIFDYHMPEHSNVYGNGFRCLTGYAANTATTPTTYTPETDECRGQFQANLQNYDALVNGYLDLGTYFRVTPYIGAGVGLGFGHYQTASSYYGSNGSSYDVTVTKGSTVSTYDYDRTASHTYYNVAYALMAGFAFPIYDHTKIDIGYRYLDLGQVLGTNLHFNEVRAGLRYMIDN